MKINLTEFYNKSQAKVECNINQKVNTHFELTYLISNEPRLNWPNFQNILINNDLWKDTCLELFIKNKSQKNYYEFNFAPSGSWNLYKFTDYREGLQTLAQHFTPKIECINKNGAHQLNVSIDLRNLNLTSELEINMTSILNIAGKNTFWAQKHNAKAPDFHSPNCYTSFLAT